jgi:hypothetical protein
MSWVQMSAAEQADEASAPAAYRQGVVDTAIGQKVARDPEPPCDGLPWLNEQKKSMTGIGPIEGESVHCVGLWGGTLPASSGRFVVSVRQ